MMKRQQQKTKNPERGQWIGILACAGALALSCVSVGSSGSITRISRPDGEEFVLQMPSGAFVSDLAFSPDGTMTIAAGSEGRLYDLNGTLLREFDHPAPTWSCDFSPDGSEVVTGANELRRWSLDGQLLAEMPHGFTIYTARYSPDGQSLVTAAGDGYVRIWDRNGTLKNIMLHDPNGARMAVFAPNGRTILSGGEGGKAKLWDLNGNLIREYDTGGGRVFAVAFSPDGNRILTGTADAMVRLWSVSGQIQRIYTHQAAVSSVQFSRDGRFFVSAGEVGHIWDLAGNDLRQFPHDGAVYSVNFAPDGTALITSGYSDNQTRIWQLPEQFWPRPEQPARPQVTRVVLGSVFTVQGDWITVRVGNPGALRPGMRLLVNNGAGQPVAIVVRRLFHTNAQCAAAPGAGRGIVNGAEVYILN